MEALKEAGVVKSLSKRATLALCVHGINKKYCKTCLSAKKPAKKSAKAAAAEAEASPETAAE